MKVGPGCDHCYADALDNRTGGNHWGHNAPRRPMSEAYWRAPLKWDRDAAHAGERRRVFPSMCDPFDNAKQPEGSGLPSLDDMRDRFGDLIKRTPNLNWLLLTKRIGNAEPMLREMFDSDVPPNVWLGATVVNQQEADRDVAKLRVAKWALGIRIAFLSVEPMLGPIHDIDLSGIDVVICGGESGPGARPIHHDWVDSLLRQCQDQGVMFHFKQWGEWLSLLKSHPGIYPHGVIVDGEIYQGRKVHHFDNGDVAVRMGKKATGHTFRGRVWQDMPS